MVAEGHPPRRPGFWRQLLVPAEPGASLVLVTFLGGAALMDWPTPSLGVAADLVRGIYAAGVALLACAMVLGLIEAWRDIALRVVTAAFASLGIFWFAAILLRICGVAAVRPSVVADLPRSFFFAMFMWALGNATITWWAERHTQPNLRG